jgi:hypothetical protein
MKLGWNRAEDGVITVYAHLSTGKVVEVADFWVSPLVAAWGQGSRANALKRQQEIVEFLVAAWNATGSTKVFVDLKDEDCPYYYVDGEEDTPETAQCFVVVPPGREDMDGTNGCWLGVAGCAGNCGSYGCGG